ncbi:hypothetical protein GOBAR_AA32487 [Gossypium barbadense]|uniref:non-specific serine/threonine protein kinase n=1 Tax=Gossypium barbadense TaxID=3634 RepID=A0A2P5WAX5_GOSBA|nr:hypothetical protein GOBAR_AA32487 [Gossypium barbadense]
MTIAVKVFHVNQDRAFKSFDIECEVLRNIRHRNLVKIINSCSNVEFKALELEFMPNRSLEKWLYSQNHFLNVLQRLNIVIDIALAVEYLHHDHSLSVVHCDIKPNNILLETEMVAHLGDFGIAKLLGKKDSMIQTKTLATIGCMSPDSKLLNTREREGLAAKDCKLFILQLALECSAEVAEERTDMEEVVARLKKIKTMYLHGTEQV